MTIIIIMENLFVLSFTAVRCDRLRNIGNGRVALSDTAVGSTATYSCLQGFTLEGRAARTCQDSGQWTGEAPTCERKLLKL